MTNLVRVNSGVAVGLPITLEDGTRFVVPATVLINSAGSPISVQGGTELDTTGEVVPVYRSHTYTYDASGNLATDSVADGAGTWVRSYTYVNGNMATDSGWVKQ